MATQRRSKRDEVYDEIMKARDEEVRGEIDDHQLPEDDAEEVESVHAYDRERRGEIEDKEDEEEESEDEEEVEETEEEEDSDLDFWVDDETGAVMTRVVVNGEPQVIKAEDLKTSYQKDKAATQRFQQAAQKEKELEKRQREFQQFMEQARGQRSVPQQQAPPHVTQANVDIQNLIKEHQKALFDGEEEKGAELMLQILELNSRSATEKAQTEVRNWQQRQALDEQHRFQAVVERAQAKFIEKFPKVANDPMARMVANQYSAQLRQTDPELTPEANLLKAGNMAVEYLGEKFAEVTNNKTDLEDRRERKRRKTLPRVKSSGKKQERAKPEKPQTAKEAVAEIAKSRGQKI